MLVRALASTRLPRAERNVIMTVDQLARIPERWLHTTPAGGPIAILILAGEETLGRTELQQLVENLSHSLNPDGRQVEPSAQRIDDSHVVHLDHTARRLVLGDEEVALTHLEFELLAYLVRNRGRAVTRAELMERVWNYQVAASDRTVDVHVRRLRRKLAGTLRLTTVRGYGYRFDGWSERQP